MVVGTVTRTHLNFLRVRHREYKTSAGAKWILLSSCHMLQATGQGILYTKNHLVPEHDITLNSMSVHFTRLRFVTLTQKIEAK